MSQYRGFDVVIGRETVWANHPIKGHRIAQAWHGIRMWNLRRPSVEEAVRSVCRQIDAHLRREREAAEQLRLAEAIVVEEQQTNEMVEEVLR